MKLREDVVEKKLPRIPPTFVQVMAFIQPNAKTKIKNLKAKKGGVDVLIVSSTPMPHLLFVFLYLVVWLIYGQMNFELSVVGQLQFPV